MEKYVLISEDKVRAVYLSYSFCTAIASLFFVAIAFTDTSVWAKVASVVCIVLLVLDNLATKKVLSARLFKRRGSK